MIDDLCEFRNQKVPTGKSSKEKSQKQAKTNNATNDLPKNSAEPSCSACSPQLDLNGMSANISFLAFCKLTEKIANEPAYTGKTAIIKSFLNYNEDVSNVELTLLLKLLLPGQLTISLLMLVDQQFFKRAGSI